MFDWFKKKPPAVAPAPREPKVKAPVKTEKELATEKNEPYVAMVRMDIDLCSSIGQSRLHDETQ
jgi:hypothetical protein